MENLFGIMQGRLLPKYKGRYQAHPKGYWQNEFVLAQKLSLQCIEFIFDYEDFSENPLITKEGISSIQKIVTDTGVDVVSVCADYFMEKKLFSTNNIESNESKNILLRLLGHVKILGVKNIVMPCVDQSALDNDEKIERIVKILRPIMINFENADVNLSLETDLHPRQFVKLLNNINSNKIKVNYDLGNSASKGFLVKEELNCYGSLISDVHIKDRKLNSGSTVLGTGDVNFDEFFSEFKKFNYNGPFIMQAFRDNEGIEIFKRQYNFIKPYITNYYE